MKDSFFFFKSVRMYVSETINDFSIFYEITNRCSYMQSILFHCLVHSTCFGCFTHPSSGVKFLTVSTAIGTNHSIVSATYSQRGPVGSNILVLNDVFHVYGSVHHNIFYEITNRCSSYMQSILFHC